MKIFVPTLDGLRCDKDIVVAKSRKSALAVFKAYAKVKGYRIIKGQKILHGSKCAHAFVAAPFNDDVHFLLKVDCRLPNDVYVF